MTTEQFLELAKEVAERFPGARLEKNQVGNLSIVVDGEWAGYVDLEFPEVVAT